MDTTTWIIAGASVATALATAGLMMFALVQWRSLRLSVDESAKTRSASILLKIYDIMQALRPKWHELYGIPDEFKNWNEVQRDLADYVGTELQRVSYLCVKGLIEPDFIIDGWGDVFIQCWNKLERFIKDYRTQCGEPAELEKGAYKRKHFELFTRQCRQFFHQKYFI